MHNSIEVEKVQRNACKKKILENVLTKVTHPSQSVMNHTIQESSSRDTANKKAISTAGFSRKGSGSKSLFQGAHDPVFKPIMYNGQKIETYKDLIPHI